MRHYSVTWWAQTVFCKEHGFGASRTAVRRRSRAATAAMAPRGAVACEP